MKKLVATTAVTLALGAGTALAQTNTTDTAPGTAPGSSASAPVPASPHTLTGNLTLVTDYRFRGISQTFGGSNFWGPAIQGGFDYSHASGFYAGNWNSNVSGNTFPNGSSIEMDFYGGWKKTWDDWGLDLGTIFYYYPNSKYPSGVNQFGEVNSFSNTNNWEIYVGGSWKFLSLKYYYALTDYFGLTEGVIQNWVGANPNTGASPLSPNGGTRGTQYLVASASYEIIPKVTLLGSAGYTWVKNYADLSYFDYKVGVVYDWNSWLLGLALVGTNANKDYWYAVNGEGKVRELGAFNAVLSIGRTF
jgi:uncharacterized protein (TIGR02001 family)